MKLKRLGTLLLTAIIAATTLAGCGAMPSTGNGNETGENRRGHRWTNNTSGC